MKAGKKANPEEIYAAFLKKVRKIKRNFPNNFEGKGEFAKFSSYAENQERPAEIPINFQKIQQEFETVLEKFNKNRFQDLGRRVSEISVLLAKKPNTGEAHSELLDALFDGELKKIITKEQIREISQTVNYGEKLNLLAGFLNQGSALISLEEETGLKLKIEFLEEVLKGDKVEKGRLLDSKTREVTSEIEELKAKIEELKAQLKREERQKFKAQRKELEALEKAERKEIFFDEEPFWQELSDQKKSSQDLIKTQELENLRRELEKSKRGKLRIKEQIKVLNELKAASEQKLKALEESKAQNKEALEEAKAKQEALRQELEVARSALFKAGLDHSTKLLELERKKEELEKELAEKNLNLELKERTNRELQDKLQASVQDFSTKRQEDLELNSELSRQLAEREKEILEDRARIEVLNAQIVRLGKQSKDFQEQFGVQSEQSRMRLAELQEKDTILARLNLKVLELEQSQSQKDLELLIAKEQLVKANKELEGQRQLFQENIRQQQEELSRRQELLEKSSRQLSGSELKELEARLRLEREESAAWSGIYESGVAGLSSLKAKKAQGELEAAQEKQKQREQELIAKLGDRVREQGELAEQATKQSREKAAIIEELNAQLQAQLQQAQQAEESLKTNQGRLSELEAQKEQLEQELRAKLADQEQQLKNLKEKQQQEIEVLQKRQQEELAKATAGNSQAQEALQQKDAELAAQKAIHQQQLNAEQSKLAEQQRQLAEQQEQYLQQIEELQQRIIENNGEKVDLQAQQGENQQLIAQLQREIAFNNSSLQQLQLERIEAELKAELAKIELEESGGRRGIEGEQNQEQQEFQNQLQQEFNSLQADRQRILQQELSALSERALEAEQKFEQQKQQLEASLAEKEEELQKQEKEKQKTDEAIANLQQKASLAQEASKKTQQDLERLEAELQNQVQSNQGISSQSQQTIEELQTQLNAAKKQEEDLKSKLLEAQQSQAQRVLDLQAAQEAVGKAAEDLVNQRKSFEEQQSKQQEEFTRQAEQQAEKIAQLTASLEVAQREFLLRQEEYKSAVNNQSLGNLEAEEELKRGNIQNELELESRLLELQAELLAKESSLEKLLQSKLQDSIAELENYEQRERELLRALQEKDREILEASLRDAGNRVLFEGQKEELDKKLEKEKEKFQEEKLQLEEQLRVLSLQSKVKEEDLRKQQEELEKLQKELDSKKDAFESKSSILADLESKNTTLQKANLEFEQAERMGVIALEQSKEWARIQDDVNKNLNQLQANDQEKANLEAEQMILELKKQLELAQEIFKQKQEELKKATESSHGKDQQIEVLGQQAIANGRLMDNLEQKLKEAEKYKEQLIESFKSKKTEFEAFEVEQRKSLEDLEESNRTLLKKELEIFISKNLVEEQRKQLEEEKENLQKRNLELESSLLVLQKQEGQRIEESRVLDEELSDLEEVIQALQDQLYIVEQKAKFLEQEKMDLSRKFEMRPQKDQPKKLVQEPESLRYSEILDPDNAKQEPQDFLVSLQQLRDGVAQLPPLPPHYYNPSLLVEEKLNNKPVVGVPVVGVPVSGVGDNEYNEYNKPVVGIPVVKPVFSVDSGKKGQRQSRWDLIRNVLPYIPNLAEKDQDLKKEGLSQYPKLPQKAEIKPDDAPNASNETVNSQPRSLSARRGFKSLEITTRDDEAQFPLNLTLEKVVNQEFLPVLNETITPKPSESPKSHSVTLNQTSQKQIPLEQSVTKETNQYLEYKISVADWGERRIEFYQEFIGSESASLLNLEVFIKSDLASLPENCASVYKGNVNISQIATKGLQEYLKENKDKQESLLGQKINLLKSQGKQESQITINDIKDVIEENYLQDVSLKILTQAYQEFKTKLAGVGVFPEYASFFLLAMKEVTTEKLSDQISENQTLGNPSEKTKESQGFSAWNDEVVNKIFEKIYPDASQEELPQYQEIQNSFSRFLGVFSRKIQEKSFGWLNSEKGKIYSAGLGARSFRIIAEASIEELKKLAEVENFLKEGEEKTEAEVLRKSLEELPEKMEQLKLIKKETDLRKELLNNAPDNVLPPLSSRSSSGSGSPSIVDLQDVVLEEPKGVIEGADEATSYVKEALMPVTLIPDPQEAALIGADASMVEPNQKALSDVVVPIVDGVVEGQGDNTLSPQQISVLPRNNSSPAEIENVGMQAIARKEVSEDLKKLIAEVKNDLDTPNYSPINAGISEPVEGKQLKMDHSSLRIPPFRGPNQKTRVVWGENAVNSSGAHQQDQESNQPKQRPSTAPSNPSSEGLNNSETQRPKTAR